MCTQQGRTPAGRLTCSNFYCEQLTKIMDSKTLRGSFSLTDVKKMTTGARMLFFLVSSVICFCLTQLGGSGRSSHAYLHRQ